MDLAFIPMIVTQKATANDEGFAGEVLPSQPKRALTSELFEIKSENTRSGKSE